MTKLEKAEFYLKLAERATSRYNSRRQLEWRANFGIWALYVSAAAIIVSSSWNPSYWITTLAIVLALGLWIAYSFFWLQYISETLQRDAKTSWYWERYAELTVNSRLKLPKVLWPGKGTSNGYWPLPTDPDPPDDVREAVPLSFSLNRVKAFHAVQWFEVAVTLVFTVLFCCVIVEKASSKNQKKMSLNGVKLEAEKVDIQP